MNILGYATCVLFFMDWGTARLIRHRLGKQAWLGYEKISAPLNIMVFSAWIILGHFPFYFDLILAIYVLLQAAGLWVLRRGEVETTWSSR